MTAKKFQVWTNVVDGSNAVILSARGSTISFRIIGEACPRQWVRTLFLAEWRLDNA